MRCGKAKRLISLYVAPDESWLSAEDRQALEAHMAGCGPCRRDCRESRKAIGILRNSWEISADTAALLKKESRKERLEASGRAIKLHRIFRRVAVWAVAACLVIGVLGYWAFLNWGKWLPEQIRSVALTSQEPLVIELVDGGRIAPGAIIQTSGRETKHLVLNGQHQVVMNADTKLSIEPFVNAGRIGCLVNLILGEVYVDVEHDGNPFVVQSAHGRAVVTGTKFDVQTTDTGTTLVVVEGSVRFESEKGFMEVASGQISKIIAHSAPTNPVSYNTTKLMAWATAYELKPTLAKTQSISADDYDLTDLEISAISNPPELDNIDYEDWVEEKRAWFKWEFPWADQLRNALMAEGIEADYPDLLISSGDIWQFEFPGTSSQQIPIFHFERLLKTASKYGFDKAWLTANVPAAKSVNDGSVSEDLYTDTKAFEHWAGCFEKLRQTQDIPNSGTLLCSLHSAAYLTNTRTLAWLSLMNGHWNLPEDSKAEILSLLQIEVNVINKLAGRIIHLITASEGRPCENS